MLKKFFLFFSTLVIISTIFAAGGLYYLVVVEPGDEIRIENIRRILGKESHVFYSDGKTRLGVFFDKAHRQYVTYSQIPDDFVNALVASEDDRFFSHFGFDIIGIARAMIKNIAAGRIVQGGSTLTQQTAKNLFKRTDRSIEAKLKELLFALRLEYRYSKEQIFEFYANQFYVSGNGHGLGVAARYYFDKKSSELSLVESAFIAGSVKRPNYYNPFIKKSKKAADLARQRAKIRLKYVLGKMRTLGMIDNYTYNQAVSSEIPFKQGKVGFSLDYAMEMVKDAVSSTEVLNSLAVHGITNVATSGVKVITTVDRDLQEKTLSVLRGELSRLDVRLRGYTREEVQGELEGLNYRGDSRLVEDAFLFGKIKNIDGKAKNIKLNVEFDRKIGMGIIDYEGLKKTVTALAKYKKNRWSEPERKDLDDLLGELKVGDRVWVSVRSLLDRKNALLNLEKYPKVQGGAIVLKNGRIKGMAGGTENRFYNRAVYARRTMGSAFKPFVFTAALQLGWNSSDLLKNSRDVFVYHDRPYFPRPDHKSPFGEVSMSWAGVHSENVASVWLLSHLCDHLNPAQFHEVARRLDLAPRIVDGEEEPYRTYRDRIRDHYGLVVDQDALLGAAFREAVINLETDFIFDGMLAEYKIIKGLHFGLHFEKFLEDLKQELVEKGQTLHDYEKKEIALRQHLLQNSYLLLAAVREEMRNYLQSLDSAGDDGDYDPFAEQTSTFFLNNLTGEVSFGRMDNAGDQDRPISREKLLSYLARLDNRSRHEFLEKVKLNGLLNVGAFDTLQEQVKREYGKLQKGLPYSFATLSKVKDFRIMAGLHYLVRMGEELGIKSRLEPVLSFPLGSNVVTLLETTRMYEAMVTGMVTDFGDENDEESSESLAILDRIESEDGKILYRPARHEKTAIDARTRLSIGHILENIVKFGTGKKADKTVRLSVKDSAGEGPALDLAIPLLGKTGTANRYTNASFFGYLPGLSMKGEELTIDGGYAVGVYVGFDDNKPMRRKSSRITGSAGALPAWCKIVNNLLLDEKYGSRLDPVDLSFYGLVLKRDPLGQMNLAVDPDQGGKLVEPVKEVDELLRYQPAIMTFGRKNDVGQFEPGRYFVPFWDVETGR